jgi:VanZ family protein
MNAEQRLRLAPFWWACGWIFMAAVVIGSVLPSKGPPPVAINDKLMHFGAYWMMAFWFAGVTQKRRYPLIAVGLLALGAVMEVAQSVMQVGRTAEWLDFAANSLGVASALAVAYAGLGSWLYHIERRLGL